MKELIDCTAAELVEHISHGRVSAVKVLEAHLARVDALNPILNAICTINPAAQQDAQGCDARLARGAMARALEGVPVVIKDNIETGGLRTTFGSLLSQDFVPPDDALLVKRLRAAGAIIIGKTNTPEFAADINTTNKVFGQTRNPWDV
ncbi:MAG: amidase, partial [Gammaproteobacteria bacterium]|nr:amidase [Gammaproteobacteria bacterium]